MSYQIKNVNNKVEIVKRNQKKFEPEKYSNWSYKLTRWVQQKIWANWKS